MAVDMFIKIAKVTGESTDSEHKGEIDVLTWSWGASQHGAGHVGGGSGAGKVQINDLSFTKYVDKSSATLLSKCCHGDHIPDAILYVRKAGGKNPLTYLKITMNSVLVTSLSTGGSGGEDRLTENITLNFAKVKMEYTPQSDSGGGAASVAGGWDIAQNKSWD